MNGKGQPLSLHECGESGPVLQSLRTSAATGARGLAPAAGALPPAAGEKGSPEHPPPRPAPVRPDPTLRGAAGAPASGAGLPTVIQVIRRKRLRSAMRSPSTIKTPHQNHTRHY